MLPPERVRAQLAAERGGADVIFDEDGNRIGGARMTAVVTLKLGQTGRHYRLPMEADYEAVRKAQERLAEILDGWERKGKRGLCPVPDEPLPPIGTLGFRVQRYGMLQWGDLFTARQKVALQTLAAGFPATDSIARPVPSIYSSARPEPDRSPICRDYALHDFVVCSRSALGTAANTDSKLLIYGLFQKG